MLFDESADKYLQDTIERIINDARFLMLVKNKIKQNFDVTDNTLPFTADTEKI